MKKREGKKLVRGPLPKTSSGREGFAREWEGKKLTRKPLPKASVRFVRAFSLDEKKKDIQ